MHPITHPPTPLCVHSPAGIYLLSLRVGAEWRTEKLLVN